MLVSKFSLHKMKNLKILAAVLVILLGSCTKAYKELNTNPNGVAVAVPERLLNPAVYSVAQFGPTRAHTINNDLMQVWVSVNEADELHRYVIRPAVSNTMWNTWYQQKTNFLDMYRIANEAPTKGVAYMAIANIMDAHVTSMLTDTYGDIPYFDANKGYTDNILTPKFDRQKDIYQDIFKKLEEANTLLTATITLSDMQKGLDALYAGDMTKWRKFGNALYMRLLLRVSYRTDLIAGGMSPIDKLKQIIATPATYPVFANNSESAVLNFTGETYPLRSPFASWRTIDFIGGGGLADFFVNNLTEWGDPRIALWSTKVDNEYAGIPSGYATGLIPAIKSVYPTALRLDSRFGAIITYSELQFILAELAAKGIIAGSAQTYYNNGIQSGIEYWGQTLPTGYLNSSEIIWDDTLNEDQKMEKIHLQKYYTLFFTDFQQWFEYRRTGHPVLTKGQGVRNDKVMPTRLYYPVIVQSLNRSNYNDAIAKQGPDDLKTLVWWQEKQN